MPSRPFETIHLDYKVGLPPSGPENHVNILVVICALTRYSLLIPLASRTARSTFLALLNNVFCHYGIPQKIVSDNEFDTALLREMSDYYGFRRIHITPYNPQANGIAESTVQRVKRILERHTKRFRDWSKILPLAQYMLNCSYHSGIKDRPFVALFGREPTTVPDLENPASMQPTGTGTEFLRSMRARIQALWADIKVVSDQVREARRLRALAETPKTTLVVKPGDEVWLIDGTLANAKQIAKSGHGKPHKYRYKVLEVDTWRIRVAPLDGAPAVMEWQPLHKAEKCHGESHESDFEHRADETGLSFTRSAMEPITTVARSHPLGPVETVGQPPNADGTYEVEDILEATKRSNKWHVLVKWAGWTQPTEELRSEILAGCGTEVRAWCDAAVARALLRGQLDGTMQGEPLAGGAGEDEPQPAEEEAVFAIREVAASLLSKEDVGVGVDLLRASLRLM